MRLFLTVLFSCALYAQTTQLDVWELQKDALKERASTGYVYAASIPELNSDDQIYEILLPSYIGISAVFVDDSLIYTNSSIGVETRVLRLTFTVSQISKKRIKIISQTPTSNIAVKVLAQTQLKSYNAAERNNSYVNQQLVKIGIFSMLAVLAIALFIGFHRDLSYVFLFLFSCSELFEFMFSYRMYSGGIYVGLYAYLYEIFVGLNLLHGLFLSLFLIFHFKLRRMKQVVLGCLLLHAVTLFFGESTNIYGNLIYALGISYFALTDAKRRAMPIIIGLVLFLVLASLDHASFVPFGFSFGVLAFLVCLIISIGYTIAEQNEKLVETANLLAQSEAKLLRQSIQPHFIMNTLLSTISWIKKEPDTAIRQIEVLADEFSSINDIADKKRISIDRELEICQNYLELMSIRKDVSYTLSCKNVEHNLEIPPLIFHTLIENGLTHSFNEKRDGHFEIEYQLIENKHVFFVRNNGASPTKDVSDEGLGFSYIRKRLQSEYSDNWTLGYGFQNGMWVVKIEFSQ